MNLLANFMSIFIFIFSEKKSIIWIKSDLNIWLTQHVIIITFVITVYAYNNISYEPLSNYNSTYSRSGRNWNSCLSANVSRRWIPRNKTCLMRLVSTDHIRPKGEFVLDKKLLVLFSMKYVMHFFQKLLAHFF